MERPKRRTRNLRLLRQRKQTRRVKPSRFATNSSVRVFGNELILGRVSKWIPIGDVLELRRTNKLWNHAFNWSMRTRHTSICFGHDKLWISLCSSGLKRDLGRFIRLMKASPEIPFGRYSFHLDPQHDHPHPFGREWKYFLQICGATMTSLTISTNCADTSPSPLWVETARKLVFELPQVIRLRELEFWLKPSWAWWGWSNREREPSPATPWQPQHANRGSFPSSVRIRIKNEARHVTHTWFRDLTLDVLHAAATDAALVELAIVESQRCLPTLSALRFNSGSVLSKLKSLHIDDFDELEPLLDFVSKSKASSSRVSRCWPLQLDSLSLQAYHIDERTSQLLHEFLRSQTPTLRKLKLVWQWWLAEVDSPVMVEFPRMDELKEFGVHLPEKIADGRILLRFAHDSFATAFPRLRKLALEGKNLEHSIQTLQLLAHDHVSELVLDKDVTVTAELLDRLRTQLPAVTKCTVLVKVDLTPSSTPTAGRAEGVVFSALCNAWPELLSLSVKFERKGWKSEDGVETLNLDELLSGIPEVSSLNQVELELCTGVVTLDRLTRISAKYKTRPGLSDLRHLQNFELGIWLLSPSYKLTNIGAYLGLALAAASGQLKYIGVKERYSSIPLEVTRKCKALILETMGPRSALHIQSFSSSSTESNGAKSSKHSQNSLAFFHETTTGYKNYHDRANKLCTNRASTIRRPRPMSIQQPAVSE